MISTHKQRYGYMAARRGFSPNFFNTPEHSTRHKVIGNPTNNQYFTPSVNKSKLWLRHELLLVK